LAGKGEGVIMSGRPQLGSLRDLITDDDWDEVMEGADTADNSVYEDPESEDEQNLEEYEETSDTFGKQQTWTHETPTWEFAATAG